MDLATLEQLIASLRKHGVRHFVGTFGGAPVDILLDGPAIEAKPQGPSEAKRKETAVRRQLDEDWSHVGGPPDFVLQNALEHAELQPAAEPD